MGSSCRRKARRLQLGANPNAIAVRWMGQWTVQVQIVRRKSTRGPIPMKARVGAERSRLTRRRKRGLRKGRRRSRGYQPRRSVPDRQPLPKPPTLRSVKHRRRPERWIGDVSYRFSQACSKFVRVRGAIRACRVDHGPTCTRVRCEAVRKMRRDLSVTWRCLHDRSAQLGLPTSMAFSKSFERYLHREFSTEGRVFDWELLAGSEPFRWITSAVDDVHKPPPEPRKPVRKRPDRPAGPQPKRERRGVNRCSVCRGTRGPLGSCRCRGRDSTR